MSVKVTWKRVSLRRRDSGHVPTKVGRRKNQSQWSLVTRHSSLAFLCQETQPQRASLAAGRLARDSAGPNRRAARQLHTVALLSVGTADSARCPRGRISFEKLTAALSSKLRFFN